MNARYNELDEMALSILMDYSNGLFPLDTKAICEKLRIKLIPYSQLNKEKMEEINTIAYGEELRDGFSLLLQHPDEDNYIAYTYYNDDVQQIKSTDRINYTIAHEIKHVIYNEMNPTIEQEKEAEHFARMLLAPTCVLIVDKYNDAISISEHFGITLTASQNALLAKENRTRKTGDLLSGFEKIFIGWYLFNLKK